MYFSYKDKTEFNKIKVIKFIIKEFILSYTNTRLNTTLPCLCRDYECDDTLFDLSALWAT